MSLSFEFIFLIIFIVVPGLLFQRFYFLGEFSKQFNTKGSVYRAIFFSIIPGIFIQLFALLLYAIVHFKSVYLADTFEVCYELLKSEKIYSANVISFIEKGYSRFILHQFFVIILSVFFGGFLHIIVRWFNLDIKYKILRFRNQWYYIFSGELNDLKKFKQFNLNNVGKEKGKKKLKHYLTQIDVLVSNGNEKNAFITGFLVDYDLNYENINELDKIYLKNVVRYRDIKDSDGERKLETVGSKTKVSISGDVFILDANKIINMNIIYVPKLVSFSKKPEMKILSNIYFFGSILNIVVFFLFVYSLFNNNFSLNLEIFDHSLNWFQKLFLAFTLIQFNSIWMPSIHGEHKNKYKYVRKDIFETFKALLFFSLITLLFIFYNDLWILIKSFFI